MRIVFMLVFAQNLTMLLMGNMLCGFPWGALSSCPDCMILFR